MRLGNYLAAAASLLMLAASTAQAQSGSSKTANQAALVFSGGHETDPRDRGRPVVLVGGALGVSADVFRDAFSRVRPAPAGTEPDPQQVRQNKAALMQALGQYGISNERLDVVSNYYRYRRSRGEMWPTTPASGYAQLKHGKVIGFVITSGGSGYSSPPSVSVSGMSGVVAQAKLSFSQDFAANGSIASVTLEQRGSRCLRLLAQASRSHRMWPWTSDRRLFFVLTLPVRNRQ